MLNRRTHDLDYLQSGQADKDLRRLALGSRPLWAIITAFTSKQDDEPHEDDDLLSRDEYWELFYAASRFGQYLDEIRPTLHSFHDTRGERIDVDAFGALAHVQRVRDRLNSICEKFLTEVDAPADLA